MEAGFGAGVAAVKDVDEGGWRTESATRGAGCIARAHLEHPGHAARVAGQERDRSRKCREHAFGCADSGIAP